MKLSEWKKVFLEKQFGPNPSDEECELFGKPYILKSALEDIHLAVIDGSPLVTTKLIEAGALVFEWEAYDYGCCAPGEEPFAIPPLLYWQGLFLKDVEPLEGEIDWDAEISKLKLVETKRAS